VRIVSVYFDDYDKPLIGRIVTNDEDAIALIERLQAVNDRCKKMFVVQQETPDTEVGVTVEMEEMARDAEEDV